jgi:hypothetical protein
MAHNWAESGLNTAGSGRVLALYFGLGLFSSLGAYFVKLGSCLDFYYISKKVSSEGLAKHPGPVWLELLVYLVKARACRLELGPTQP